MMRSSSSTASPGPDLFGPMLRTWRRRRGASQLALALQSGVSQRHVSFLESGRARPSREMVVQLSSALDVPLRQRNAMLLAAGFAPAYRETNLAAPELAPVARAIDHMLRQQEPYPAMVIDRLWNLVRANKAASAFIGLLFGGPPPAPPAGKPPNVLHWLLDPKALRPRIANWEEVARHLVSATYAEILADPLNSASLRSSAGKKHSMRTSWSVTSCGVPSVAMVVNTDSVSPPTTQSSVSTGCGRSSKRSRRNDAGTSG